MKDEKGNPYDIKVTTKQEISISDVFFELVYRCEDPKKVLTVYGTSCLYCGAYSPDNRKDEIAKAGVILGYVVTHWDELYEPAMKHYHECVEKAEKRKKHES